MRVLAAILLVQWLTGCLTLVAAETPSRIPAPVLVELFTSEGCSSCPPADALLSLLDTQPIPGVQLIVLSEHVDYWNHVGWKDPYSSKFFSDRQSSYAQKMGTGPVYTPQMIVDGTREFVGSDGKKAQTAIEKSIAETKLPVVLTDVTVNHGMLHGKVEIGALPEALHIRSADVYVAAALNHAESQVLRGENKGRNLQHVAVVKNVTRIGSAHQAKGFRDEINLKIDSSDPANLRIVVFVQESGTGRILGASSQQMQK